MTLERRTELARTEMRRAKSARLPAKSARRVVDDVERSLVIVAVKVRDGYQCRAAPLVPHVACGGGLDVHEIIPRSAWARGWLVVANCLTICRFHHRWVDVHPTDAHAVGLHGFSWERPEETR